MAALILISLVLLVIIGFQRLAILDYKQDLKDEQSNCGDAIRREDKWRIAARERGYLLKHISFALPPDIDGEYYSGVWLDIQNEIERELKGKA